MRSRLRELATEQRRFGYRRLHILLRTEGHVLNRKKARRLYREEGLTVRKRKSRKRATGARAPILVEAKPNARWSVDFIHDQLFEWSALPHPQRDRRRDQERLGGGRRHLTLGSQGGARTRRDHRAARHTRSSRLRSRNRVHLQRHASLGSRQSGRLAFHCAW